MSQLLLLDDKSTVRNRRNGVRGIVQELDVFMKISDEVKEKPKAAKGLLTVVSFTLIIFLLIGQLYEYFTNEEVSYKFLVDTEYNHALKLDIDMIIATPCNLLSIMPMGVELAEKQSIDLLQLVFDDRKLKKKKKNLLEKNPTRFEMNDEELYLWNILQKVHKEHFKPGTQLKPVNEKFFVNEKILQELRNKADKKQEIELNELSLIKKKNIKENENLNEGNVVFIVGNGFGVFQIISTNNEMNSISDTNEGTACRINGKIPVLKGTGDRLTISVEKLGFENIMAHLTQKKIQQANISHRIERFHFGPHIWGLVTPLVGKEEIVNETGIIFQYFIKVVPTKIYSITSNLLFNRPDITYQYAVTYGRRKSLEMEFARDSIIFDYEFSEIIVEVWPLSISLVQLFLRMCSIVGGIFATSRLIEILLSNSLNFMF